MWSVVDAPASALAESYANNPHVEMWLQYGLSTIKYVVLSEARNTYVYVKSHNFYVTLKLLIYKPNTVCVLDLNPLGTTSCCLFQMRILDSRKNKDAGIMN